jgi:hypothetical protein
LEKLIPSPKESIGPEIGIVLGRLAGGGDVGSVVKNGTGVRTPYRNLGYSDRNHGVCLLIVLDEIGKG